MNNAIIGGNELPYNLRAGGILIYSVGQLSKQSFKELGHLGTHFIDVRLKCGIYLDFSFKLDSIFFF